MSNLEATLRGLGLLVVAVIAIVGGAFALDALGGALPKFPLIFVQHYSNDLGNGVAWVLAPIIVLAVAFGIGKFFSDTSR